MNAVGGNGEQGVDLDGACAAAEEFLGAVRDSDGAKLWSLLSEDARNYVLSIGMQRGMAFDFVSRLRQGTAEPKEFDDYTSDLVEGIRRDLQGVDFDRLRFEAAVERPDPLRVKVTYLVALAEGIAGADTAVPAGSVLVSPYEDGWRIERLVPRPA